MSSQVIDFRDYIAHADKLLIVAEREIENGRAGDTYLIPSVILAWSAIESFVNNRLDDFASLPSHLFAPHEIAFLTEQRLNFHNEGKDAGKFTIKGNAYRALSDKILFLIVKCGTKAKTNDAVWDEFEKLRQVRDSLIHPRRARHKKVTPKLARECIAISKHVIVFISEGLGHAVDL
jgi:hypothetical protein